MTADIYSVPENQGKLFEFFGKTGIYKTLYFLLKHSKEDKDKADKIKKILTLSDFLIKKQKHKKLEEYAKFVSFYASHAFSEFINGQILKNDTGMLKRIKLEKLYWDEFCPAEMFEDRNTVIELNRLDDEIKRMFLTEEEYNTFNIRKGKGQSGRTDLLAVFKNLYSKEEYVYVADFANGIPFSLIEDFEYEAFGKFKIKSLEETSLDVINIDNTDGDKGFDVFKQADKNRIKKMFSFFYLIDREFYKLFQGISYIKDYLLNGGYNPNQKIYAQVLNGYRNRVFELNREILAVFGDLYKTDTSSFNKKELIISIFEKKGIKRQTAQKLFKLFAEIDEKASAEVLIEEEFLEGSDILNGEKKDYFILDLNLKKKHTEIIENLLNENKDIILLGNPGLGKTYSALSYFNKKIKEGQNVNVIYISPRKVVNADFISKILDKDAFKDIKNYAVLNIDSLMANPDTDMLQIHIQTDSEELIAEIKNNPAFSSLFSFEKFSEGRKRSGIKIEKDFWGEEYLYEQAGSSYEKVSEKLIEGIAKLKLFAAEKNIPLSIFSTLTAQALKFLNKRGIKELKKVFDYPEHYIFIDEITGEESAVMKIKHLLKELKRNTRFIIADASLTNPEIFKYLFENTDDNEIFISRFIHSKVSGEGGLNVYKNVAVAGTDKTFDVVGVDSYPAKNIKLEYTLLLNSKNEGVFEFAEHILDEVEKENKPVVYIQNKRVIENLKKVLLKKGIKEEDIVIMHSNVNEKKLALEREKVENDTYKLALITSSSSRGISYKKSKTILIDFQSFEIENGLMEAMQTVYRARGSEYDMTETKNIKVFFRFGGIKDLNEDTVHLKTFDALLRLYLFKGSFYTRIGKKGLKENLIPLGELKIDKTGEGTFKDGVRIIQLINRYIVPSPKAEFIKESGVYYRNGVMLRKINFVKNLFNTGEKVSYAMNGEDFFRYMNEIVSVKGFYTFTKNFYGEKSDFHLKADESRMLEILALLEEELEKLKNKNSPEFKEEDLSTVKRFIQKTKELTETGKEERMLVINGINSLPLYFGPAMFSECLDNTQGRVYTESDKMKGAYKIFHSMEGDIMFLYPYLLKRECKNMPDFVEKGLMDKEDMIFWHFNPSKIIKSYKKEKQNNFFEKRMLVFFKDMV